METFFFISPGSQEPDDHADGPRTVNSTTPFEQYRAIIAAIVDPSHRTAMSGTQFIEIVDEIERDLQLHYEVEHITLHEKLLLQMLLESARSPLGS